MFGTCRNKEEIVRKRTNSIFITAGRHVSADGATRRTFKRRFVIGFVFLHPIKKWVPYLLAIFSTDANSTFVTII